MTGKETIMILDQIERYREKCEEFRELSKTHKIVKRKDNDSIES